MRLRFAFTLVACALGAGLSLAAAAPPADASLLIRVERIRAGDLSDLLSTGIPVVMELNPCLLVEGNVEHVTWLGANGYRATILDDLAAASDYLVVGLRPDSDTSAVLALGAVIDREENWILVRVPRETSLASLERAKVFVTRVSHERLVAPRSAPAARREPEARAGAFAGADPLVQKIVDQVLPADIDLIWQDLASNPPTGTRYSTSQGCRDAAAYCRGKYEGWGLPADYQQWSANHAPNVVATQEGALYPTRVYIVEGHLDDLPSSPPAPGGDDNASGSVTALEAAKVMHCWAFKSTVKYLNVTGEEFGLYGSEYYADDAHARGEDVRGVLNFDMNGWAGDGSPNPENLDVDYNAASQWLGQLFAECATKYGTGLAVDAFLCPSLNASDHYPFWQNGYPAICGITDNEGYCGHGGNYPYYHTSNDTIANCGDPSFFHSTVKATVATLAEMAEPFKITFDKSAYACGSALLALVGDRDLNTNPAVQETVAVEVWSDTEPTPETIVLTERGANSMYFEGSAATTQGPPVHGDGALSVSPGDTVTARYVDALDCDGATNVGYQTTARIDCTGPIISNVDETSITDTSATITWTTDEDSTSTVRWGESVPPGQTASAAGFTRSHSVPLTGLRACTVYYYSVESQDVAGNLARDDSGGHYYHFETYGNFGSGLQPCHAGRATVDQSTYGCSATMTFRVTDMDLNLNPSAAETARLRVSSSSETIPEEVTVTETGPNTSTFAGSIPLAPGAPAPDGVLEVADGDVLTVTYLDADDGTGMPAVSFDTAVADCSGPSIHNLRVTDVTDQRVTVRFETGEPGNTVVEWGATPALGQTVSQPALATSHAVTVNRLSICAPFYFRASSTDAQGNTRVADFGGQPYGAHTWTIPGLYYRETFEGDVSGWTLTGEWQVGQPQGMGGSTGSPDPVGAYNNDKAMGDDLTGLGAHPGDYENSTLETATSPDLSADSWTNTKLLVYRQLNVARDDRAGIAVMTKGKQYLAWSSVGAVAQNGYSAMSVDLSGLVDGQRTVSVRFLIQSDAQGPINDDGVSSGWNVDDVILKDATLPDYGPCGGCDAAPAFGGAVTAMDNNACAATGVTVTWEQAVSWGSGGGGTYVVYRDTAAGFTPSPSNLVAVGIPGLAYDDVAAPQNSTLYYLVRAENDETCGTGPANGGMVDGNASYVRADETTSRPLPAQVAGLRVKMVNRAHLKLDWEAASGATAYRIYRSDTPQPGTFVRLAETASLSWQDLNEGGSAASHYYLVRGVNPCGQEGP